MDFADDDIQLDRRIGELIERGLECYGAGDMEGALSQWKHALALDPENERAANYLEYVEEHHDLIGESEGKVSAATVELEYPFGISALGLAKLTEQELEDYESIEILENNPESDPLEEPIEAVDSVDDGWNVDEAWVQELVSKSEAAFVANESTKTPDQSDIATVDLAIDEPVVSDEEDEDRDATNIHSSSNKLRSLAGFDELELQSRGRDEEEEEEELTQMRLDSKPISTGRGATHFSEELELELDEEEEERTNFHESPNRVGVAHDAAKGNAFSNIELGGLGDIGLEDSDDETTPPLGPTIDEAIGELELGSPPMSLARSDSVLELEDGTEPGEDEQTIQFDLGGRGSDLMDLEATRQHFAIDDELTIDRGVLAEEPRPGRAPTQDHGISPSSIHVDETLLSLQESTREFNLDDMGLALRGDAPEDDDDEYEVEIGQPEATSAPDEGDDTISFVHPDAPTEARSSGVLASIMKEAPEGDSSERAHYIVTRLIEHATEQFTEGNETASASAACQALDYAADSAGAQKIIFENERGLVQILISSMGDASQTPRLRCPMTEIPPEHIDHRAAFLLTRMDEQMTLDELLDISGMSRLEALRHLCGLHLLGYLEVV